MPILVNSEEFYGETRTRIEREENMSVNAKTPKNSLGTQKAMKHGEEPIELLLALVWSSVETLLERNSVEIFIGEGKVMMVFPNSKIIPESGLVPTLPTLPTLTANEVPTLPTEEIEHA